MKICLKLLFILIGCNFNYGLLAFQKDGIYPAFEQELINARACEEIEKTFSISSGLDFYLQKYCKQKYDNCEEVLALKPVSKMDSVLYLLSLGDCNLYSPIQKSSEAYEIYLSAYELAKSTSSKILKVEVLNKLITYNLFALTALKESNDFISEHLFYAYDSLEYSRNTYYQLRLDYPIHNDVDWDESKAIQQWEDLLIEIDSRYPKLESDIRSYYGLFLERLERFKSAEIQLLKAVELGEKVNPEFYQGIQFSSYGNIGYMKLANGKPNLALDYFKKAKKITSRMASDHNSSLLYSWIASAFQEVHQMDSAYYYLTLSTEKAKLADDFEHYTKVEEIQSKYDNEKLNNELLVEQTKKQRSNYLMIFFIGLSLLSLLIYRNQKIKTSATEKELENANLKATLEKQKALELERVRIAAEMHDDLGGGLTTIKFLSQKVLKSIDSNADKIKVEKIVSHSKKLVNNMSEIIWAMNAGFDTLESLVAYTRRFASEYLDDYAIDLKFKTEGDLSKIKLTGERRRSIFLVIKESLHNIVKHAGASKAVITFTVRQNIKVKIQDDGIGFKADENQLGNGLQNMRNRINKLKGEITYKMDNGACVEFTIPVNQENNAIT